MAADKVRHDWFQSSDEVSLTILAKNVSQDQLNVQFESQSLSVAFPLPDGSRYDRKFSLFSSISASESSSKVYPSKIEITLRKSQRGLRWRTLEAEASGDSKPVITSHPQISSSANTSSAPSYPTSSKSGPKNWDKVANDLSTNPDKKAGEKDDDDDFGGDPTNAFFQKIYKNADPDTKRAMMKSFSESNGTALSTNWAEVQKGPVETTPPDGMEAKKW